jgi:hypothetical protein
MELFVRRGKVTNKDRRVIMGDSLGGKLIRSEGDWKMEWWNIWMKRWKFGSKIIRKKMRWLVRKGP